MDYKASLTNERNQRCWERRELKGGPSGPSHIEMHPDVQRVLEFIASEFLADDLIGIAKAVALVAPVIWSQHPDVEIYPMALLFDPATKM